MSHSLGKAKRRQRVEIGSLRFRRCRRKEYGLVPPSCGGAENLATVSFFSFRFPASIHAAAANHEPWRVNLLPYRRPFRCYFEPESVLVRPDREISC